MVFRVEQLRAVSAGRFATIGVGLRGKVDNFECRRVEIHNAFSC